MANETDFTLDFTGDDQAKASPNEGGGFKRAPFGDYARVKIVDVAQRAKQGDKPHVMLDINFQLIEGPADGVGMTINGLYAGSRQSPKFMQDRLANLLRACKVTLSPGQPLSRSMLIGRECAATVVWELGKPVMDQTTGASKQYVNSRLIGERAVGEPAPTGINAAADSREAAKFLEEKYGATGLPDDTADAAPWAQPEAGAATQPAAEAAGASSGFRPEAEADGNVHTYRAYVKLGGPTGEQARAGLIGVGFDPDGPVNADLLAEPVKGEYLKRFPATAVPGGLPTLPGLGANGAAPAAAGKKTGTRQPRTT